MRVTAAQLRTAEDDKRGETMYNSVLSKRGRRVAATLAAGAAIAAFAPAGAASASPVPVAATGNTVVTIGGAAVNKLTTGSCGALSATPLGGATVATTAKNQFKLTVPITGLEVQADGSALRINHSGGVDLVNSCYEIALSTLRISNFGQADQFTTFDLSAKTNSVDDTGRQVIGQLDLSSAVVTISGSKVRVNKMDLHATDAGAEQLNELATGTSTGPFMAGDKVGNAKTTVRFSF